MSLHFFDEISLRVQEESKIRFQVLLIPWENQSLQTESYCIINLNVLLRDTVEIRISRKLALTRCINLKEDAIYYRVAQYTRASGGGKAGNLFGAA